MLLIGAPRKGTRDAQQVREHLDELARLADTAGAQVVGRVVQVVAAPTPDLYIGKGKAVEVAKLREELNASIAIVDEELSPRQGKNLEEALGVRVMDRTELILDIFALRARSREAKMQVELAQLAYLLPRLTRMWAHLSRIRGGIGLRGPGETQLETDRRMIRKKIGVLKAKLDEVTAHRGRLRERNRDRGVIRTALVGYTNAGKSSLLRALTGAEAHVEDRLFATLDTQSREVVVGRQPSAVGREPSAVGRQPSAGASVRGAAQPRLGAPSHGAPSHSASVRFTDTVGFIRKLPHDLVASFRATLEEAADSDVILHVVDASHPAWEDQMEVVGAVLDEMLEERLLARTPKAKDLMPGEVPPPPPPADLPRIVVVLNKCDLLGDAERAERLAEVEARGLQAVLTSAQTGEGLQAVTSITLLVGAGQ